MPLVDSKTMCIFKFLMLVVSDIRTAESLSAEIFGLLFLAIFQSLFLCFCCVGRSPPNPNAPINCMPQGTPPPPPREMVGIWPGWGQMYPKSPPGDRRNGQTAPPCTRGDHIADWRRSMCPTPITHLVVKFPTLGKAKRSNPRGLPGGGGGGGLAIDRCIRLWNKPHKITSDDFGCTVLSKREKVEKVLHRVTCFTAYPWCTNEPLTCID